MNDHTQLFSFNFWRTVLWIWYPGWHFSSLFSILNLPPHFLLTCRISAEKSANNFIRALLSTMSHFSPAAFNVLSVLMCIGISPFGITLVGVIWPSWIWVPILSDLGSFQPLFLQISVPFSWKSHDVHFRWVDDVLQFPYTCLTFLNSFLFLFHLDNFRRPAFECWVFCSDVYHPV
jgi:hypothetical protein